MSAGRDKSGDRVTAAPVNVSVDEMELRYSLSPAITVGYVTTLLTKWLLAEKVDCRRRFYNYNLNRCYCFDTTTWTFGTV